MTTEISIKFVITPFYSSCYSHFDITTQRTLDKLWRQCLYMPIACWRCLQISIQHYRTSLGCKVAWSLDICIDLWRTIIPLFISHASSQLFNPQHWLRSEQTWQEAPGIPPPSLSPAPLAQIPLGRLKTVLDLLGDIQLFNMRQNFTPCQTLTGKPQSITEASWSDAWASSVGCFQCQDDLKVLSTWGSSSKYPTAALHSGYLYKPYRFHFRPAVHHLSFIHPRDTQNHLAYGMGLAQSNLTIFFWSWFLSLLLLSQPSAL